jgi:hypothetical protein
VVSELKLTAEQRDRIRTIEDETLFGLMRGGRPTAPGGDSGVKERSANEGILAVLTDEQVRRWRPMTGEALKSPITPFPPPSVP